MNNYDETKEILKHSTLTCKQIADITGQSIYMAKQIRLKILNEYNNKFPYSTGARVRTDHFVEYYDNKIITNLYNSLFNLS